MTTLSYAVSDTKTMLRRNLKHLWRYKAMLVYLVATPVIFLLLFVYVFGGTLGAGLGPGLGRVDYANYLTPGIMLLTICGAATGAAIGIAMDMTEGIVARFRTMNIYRPSVLTGHMFGNMILATLGVAIVTGVCFLVGFRSHANLAEWLGVVGVLLMTTFAVAWFGVGCGLATKSVEAASNLPMPLLLLPFLGSGFVPTESMPTALAWFAQYQPFTPIMETLRGLLFGTPIGNNAWLATAWCVGGAAVCYVWSKRSYNRER